MRRIEEVVAGGGVLVVLVRGCLRGRRDGAVVGGFGRIDGWVVGSDGFGTGGSDGGDGSAVVAETAVDGGGAVVLESVESDDAATSVVVPNLRLVSVKKVVADEEEVAATDDLEYVLERVSAKGEAEGDEATEGHGAAVGGLKGAVDLERAGRSLDARVSGE
jgi:hypothetical protein